ncbi:MAG: HAMP domain-containing protein [Acidobacteria bacterium]|nr:HAMP domain-containing protein [Acidobacteriota bacterium]
MSPFRTRLFLLFALAIAATSIVLSYVISLTAERAFERLDEQRTRTLIRQFQRELDQRGREVVRRIESIAGSEPVRRLAADAAQPGDLSLYLDQAQTLAKEQALDFLEILGPGGVIVSSAHYPARFGYKKPWVADPSQDWKSAGAFVEIEELPDESAVALLAVRAVPAGAGFVYLVGGLRVDKGFLEALALPAGMRAALYRDLPSIRGGSSLEPSAALVAEVRRTGKEVSLPVRPTFGEPSTLTGIPLSGRARELLGVLLVSSSREELYELTWFIRTVGFVGALAGIALGAVIAWWASARVTRPVRELAAGAREVAAGNWKARVEVDSRDEIGDLARAFNRMTEQLAEQRGRLIQVERVAAWRELARRLAHELKNPLFPLQITVENLQRARKLDAAQFDEVFQESTATLLAELSQLKSILGRFSDFARMPAPRFEPVNIESLLATLVRLFEPQWQSPGSPPIRSVVEVETPSLSVEADPDQLNRALRNLVLNAMDAMPSGGTITLRARGIVAGVMLEVSDTGTGLTPEECERLFTPYYTTKTHGTGLGLAIVQSVVSDHGGRISVESEPGRGSSFRIELPERSAKGELNGASSDR